MSNRGTCVVYWLFDGTCSVPENDGYVGITNDPKQRLAEHRREGRLRWSGFKILFSGTRDECLEVERGYRPRPCIGWNSAAGGTPSGISFWTPKREAARQRQIGRKLSEETKAKMRAAHAARSPELCAMYQRLAKGNKSRTGQKSSEATKAKISASLIGNKRSVGNTNAVGHAVSKELRDVQSSRMKGNSIRLGAVLSEETKAKISASQQRRHAANIGG